MKIPFTSWSCHRLTLLILVPPAIWLAIVAFNDVNFPFMDEIDSPGLVIFKDATGSGVQVADFFRWHNESKKALPDLVFFSLYMLTGQWNLKWEMVASILLGTLNCLLVAAICSRLLRKTTALAPRQIDLWGGLFGLFFCLYYFAPYSFFRWINGITSHRVLPDTFLLLSLLLFLQKSATPWKKLGGYAVFSLAAQFSFAGGLVLWPITLMLLAFEAFDAFKKKSPVKSHLQRILVFFAAFSMTQYLYFHDSSACVVATTSKATDLFSFDLYRMAVYVLSFLSTGIFRHGSDRQAAEVGVFFLAFLVFIYLRLRHQADTSAIGKVTAVLGALLLYPLLLGLLAGVGRDFSSPRQIRYVLYGAYLPLVVVVATRIYLSSGNRRFGHKFLKYAVLIPLLILYVESYLDGNAFRMARQHIGKISSARACIISNENPLERRACVATIYPPALSSDKDFQEVDQRLRFLIEKRVIR